MKLIARYKDEGDLIHLASVPLPELRSLLSHATAYVFLTLAEGFGIPPIEAMRCGCPTITSSIRVMRETCGNASLFVNPYDIKEIAASIIRLIGDDPETHSLRQDLIQKGYEQSQQYTISSCQNKWQNYLENVI